MPGRRALVQPVYCGPVPQIDNGWISNRTRTYFFDDETRAQCYRGYKLNGTTVIRCGSDGKFNNVPTCLDVDECGTATPPCDQSSTTCSNVPGSYQCGCKSVWPTEASPIRFQFQMHLPSR